MTPAIPSRTGEAVAAALTGTDRTAFDRARQAAEDQETLDAVIGHWWAVAVLSADPDAHQRMLDTAAAVRAGIPVPLIPWTEARARLDL